MTLRTLPVSFDKSILTPENKCSFCTGALCCTYITQQIDTPRSKSDYTHLLWQVSHQHVKIYKDEDGWTLLVEGKCMHLQPDNRCGIYETRPEICREHSNDYCEFDAPSEDGFDLYFPSYESLLKYCKKKFKNWDGKKKSVKQRLREKIGKTAKNKADKKTRPKKKKAKA
jgi:Fe-S-cluster containining protein